MIDLRRGLRDATTTHKMPGFGCSGKRVSDNAGAQKNRGPDAHLVTKCAAPERLSADT